MEKTAEPILAPAPLQTTTCPLCSFKFNKSAATCNGCAVNSSCATIRCPQCQYEYVEDSKIWDMSVRLANRIKRFFGANPAPAVDLNAVNPLNAYAAGGEFEICQINSENALRSDRLVSLGVLPGNRLKLIQKKPSLIIRLGETEIALDREIASDIFVLKC